MRVGKDGDAHATRFGPARSRGEPEIPRSFFFCDLPRPDSFFFRFYLSPSSEGRGAVGLKKEPIQHRKGNVREQLIANATAAESLTKEKDKEERGKNW
jgi:hypothetical protein